MAKRKNWLNLLKRFFISDTHSKPAKKEKRRRWVFGRLKHKRLASIAAPSSSREGTVCEAEEQRKHAVNLAIATAAAAEAAVVAAQVTAELVRLNGSDQSSCQYEEETKEFSPQQIPTIDPQFVHESEKKEIQDGAATKIQTAFRAYLARKALRALKGLVRLQAIVRGRAVRRQAITTLRYLQSIVNIQSQVCARRGHKVDGTWHCYEKQELGDLRDKDIKRRWDDSILSKEEATTLFLSKREALIKRERMKEYLSHRRSADSEENKANGRWRHLLENWVDTQLAKREDFKSSDTVFSPKPRIRDEFGGKHTKLRNSPKQYHIEGLDSPRYVPRRSFHHRRQRSIGDGNSFAGSPTVPTYMAATESAKAKARSMSSPRLRPLSLDTCSETNSPYKYKLSPISSINSDALSSIRIANASGFHQRSPCIKSLPSLLKSSRTLNDLSFDSECSLPTWDCAVPSADDSLAAE